MTKIQVTVEMTFDSLPDDAARELARQMVEAQGFTVARVAVKAERGRVKAFVPKAYAPGWAVKVGDRLYEVWSQAEHHKGKRVDLWVVPVDRRPDDATAYRFDGHTVRPYHGDGKACQSSWITNKDYRREEVPCQHESHTRELAKAS